MPSKIRRLPLKSITVDTSIQPRAEVQQTVIDEYADALKSGAKFPPGVAFDDGQTIRLASGFHTYAAHAKASKRTMPVEVRRGGMREAILFAVGTNSTHGARRTIDDKRRAVTLLLNDPEWAEWSDRQIAKQCQVLHPFVAEVRAASGNVTSSRRAVRDGKSYTINTSNIGRDVELGELAGEASPLKWHGGKHYLAARIIALMPAHKVYVEPYAGSLAVLLAKPHDRTVEHAGDVDRLVMNFWRVLADAHAFKRFARIVTSIGVHEGIFNEARDRLTAARRRLRDPIRTAADLFIVNRQSFGGQMKSIAPLSTRARRGMDEHTAAWLSAVDLLPTFHDRLRRVRWHCRPALALIKALDSRETLFYLDPPYHPDTRETPDVYAHEMSEADHYELLKRVATLDGHCIISGYPCDAYDAALRGWHRLDFDVANNAAGGDAKRRMTESIWCNFDPAKVAMEAA
jgi:DNA adenine methylase